MHSYSDFSSFLFSIAHSCSSSFESPEAAKKGSAYVNVHMYVIREFRDAIDDCKAGKFKDNDDAVLAWDEVSPFHSESVFVSLCRPRAEQHGGKLTDSCPPQF
mmetsp:Transcript_6094/g.17824  ORF Transcript_6094/g.17824 Transcript_6094/m.17824 type:complete len:103 (+) Transcript_6094:913-1221(+)